MLSGNLSADGDIEFYVTGKVNMIFSGTWGGGEVTLYAHDRTKYLPIPGDTAMTDDSSGDSFMDFGDETVRVKAELSGSTSPDLDYLIMGEVRQL